MPGVVSFYALITAWSMVRTAREVSVGPGGLSICRQRGSQSYRWDQIGSATVSHVPMTARRRLVVFDTKGKVLAKIDEGIEEFERLADLVKQKIAARNKETTIALGKTKARRSAAYVGSVALVMFLLSGVVALITWSRQQSARELEERGIEGRAEIVQLFRWWDGSLMLEYRVTSPAGRSATRRAEVSRPVWDALNGQKNVSIRYVPDDPDNSRLTAGEVMEEEITDSPTIAYGLCIVVAVICMALLVRAIVQWRGGSP
jgi:hypothetical protein